MKVIITGCAGFIGSSATEVFLKKGHTVIGVDNFDSALYSRNLKEKNIEKALSDPLFSFNEGSILDKTLFGKLPNDTDCMIHLAAKAGVRPSILNPAAYTETNISGTLNVLEWMKEIGLKKMVFASSSSIYGNSNKIPFSENDNTDSPISPYAATKKACELLNYAWHHLNKTDIINLRFFTVFGPR
jgi:UDP-glucuronate 4-epimerase